MMKIVQICLFVAAVFAAVFVQAGAACRENVNGQRVIFKSYKSSKCDISVTNSRLTYLRILDSQLPSLEIRNSYVKILDIRRTRIESLSFAAIDTFRASFNNCTIGTMLVDNSKMQFVSLLDSSNRVLTVKDTKIENLDVQKNSLATVSVTNVTGVFLGVFEDSPMTSLTLRKVTGNKGALRRSNVYSVDIRECSAKDTVLRDTVIQVAKVADSSSTLMHVCDSEVKNYQEGANVRGTFTDAACDFVEGLRGRVTKGKFVG